MACFNFSAKARHQAAIYQKSLVADEYGGSTNTWTLLATVWAVVEPKSGNERFVQGANESTITTKIIIRYQSAFLDPAVGGQAKITIDGIDYSVAYVKSVHDDLKNHGKAFQIIGATMGGNEIG